MTAFIHPEAAQLLMEASLRHNKNIPSNAVFLSDFMLIFVMPFAERTAGVSVVF
nr:hypothetical protein [uncultured Prevotella sp.]